MYSKQNNDFSNYTDKNLVELIETLKFDADSLQKFLEKREDRIEQMRSADAITNFILAVFSQINKGNCSGAFWFFRDFCVSTFEYQFKKTFKYDDLINLISKLASNSESSSSMAFSITMTQNMLHLIQNGDQLISILKILVLAHSNQIELIEMVEKQWAGWNVNSKLTSSNNSNANQFFNNQSSISSKNDSSNDTSNDTSNETSNDTSNDTSDSSNDSSIDSSADSSSEESTYSV